MMTMAGDASCIAPPSLKMSPDAEAQLYRGSAKCRSASTSSATSADDDMAFTRVPSEATMQSSNSSSSNSNSSGSGGGSSSGDSRRPSLSSTTLIPDYEYPVPLIIKNTFFCVDEDKLSSLEGFYVERRTQSCVDRFGCLPLSEKRDDSTDDHLMQAAEALDTELASQAQVAVWDGVAEERRKRELRTDS